MPVVDHRPVTVTPDGVAGGTENTYFAAPARELAYDFKVVVYCRKAPSRRWLFRKNADQADLVRIYHLVRTTVRESARDFSIFQPAAAEQAANAYLAEVLVRAAQADRSISPGWGAHAEFTLPDKVLALMRESLGQEYSIRAKAKVAELLMSKTGELRTGWDEFLNQAAESPNAQHAVRLAENPGNVAKVLEDVLEHRRKDAEGLLTLINKIVEAHQSADILDLVVNSETVLRKTLTMMGIPLPPADGDGLLVPLDGEV